MKHTLYIYTAIGIMMMLFAACTNDNEMDNGEGAMLPVMITAESPLYATTRTAEKTNFTPGDAILLEALSTGATATYTLQTGTDGTTTWQPDAGVLLLPAEGDVDISATCTATNPADLHPGDLSRVSLFADDLHATASTQTGTIERIANEARVALSFAHSHALIIARVTDEAGNAIAATDISAIDITVASTTATGGYLIRTTGDDHTAIAPEGSISAISVALSTNGRTYRPTPEGTSAPTLLANHSYALNISLSAEKATFAITETPGFGWSVEPGKDIELPNVPGYDHTIRTEAELRAFAKEAYDNPGISAIQMANIELTEEWRPIGYHENGGNSKPFNGTYNGNGYTISGMRITQDYLYTGFFAETRNATLTGIHLRGVEMDNTSQYAGALVGYAEKSNIDGTGCISLCSATGAVSVKSDDSFRAGGLVGRATRVAISRCRSECTVKATCTSNNSYNIYAGGLAGDIVWGALALCQSTGNVSVDAPNGERVYAGGLMGYTQIAELWYSFAKGSVDVTAPNIIEIRAGGLAGYNDSAINNCYATGAVSASGSEVGSLIGLNGSSGTVSNCHASGTPNKPIGTGGTGIDVETDPEKRMETVREPSTSSAIPTTIWEVGKTYGIKIEERIFKSEDVWTEEDEPQIDFWGNGE